jgi:hypothetical protein
MKLIDPNTIFMGFYFFKQTRFHLDEDTLLSFYINHVIKKSYVAVHLLKMKLE